MQCSVLLIVCMPISEQRRVDKMSEHIHHFDMVQSTAKHNKGTWWYICSICYLAKPVDPFICKCGRQFDKISIKEHIEIEKKIGNSAKHFIKLQVSI